MQRILVRLIACLAVTATFAVAPGRTWAQRAHRPDMVFLLIGEINMCGQAQADKELGDLEPIPDVLLLRADGKWERAQHPLNRHSTIRNDATRQMIGPGAAFAARIQEAYPGKTIGLIVNARIDSNIDSWNAEAPLYRKTLDRVIKLRSTRLSGIVWQHGESNRNDKAYLNKMTDFVAQWRRDLQEPKLPFVAGEIYGQRYAVNDYLRRVPKYVRWFDVAKTRTLKTRDGKRFTRESQQQLGDALAEAWLGIAPTEFRPQTEDE